MLPRADSATHARVLARLARALQFTPFFDRRAELSNQAVLMARRLSDPATLAPVLYDRHMAIWGAANAQERLAIASEIVELGRSGDQALAIQGYALQAGNLLELGDMSAFHATIENYDHLARDLRQLQYLWLTPFLRASEATVSARFEQAEQLAQEGLMLGQQAQHQGVLAAFLATMVTIRSPPRPPWRTRQRRRRSHRAPSNAAGMAVHIRRCPLSSRPDRRRSRPVRTLGRGRFAGLPRDFTWMPGLATLAWTCASLNDREHAPILYDLLVPFAPYNVRVSRLGVGCAGPVTHYLGLLAATMSRGRICLHFKAAIEFSSRLGAPAFLAHSRLQYARVLYAVVVGPGDRAAENYLTQAHSSADSRGFGSIWMTSVNRCRGPAGSGSLIARSQPRSSRRLASACCGQPARCSTDVLPLGSGSRVRQEILGADLAFCSVGRCR